MTAIQALSIFVRGLRVEARIGLYPHEQERTQPLIIDVEIALKPCSISSIRDTVDYDTVAANARDLASDAHIGLVENFAETLARVCLENPRVASVRVRVEKLEALNGADAAGVEIRLQA